LFVLIQIIIINKQLNSSGCHLHGNHSHTYGKNYGNNCGNSHGSNYLHQLQVAPTHVITLILFIYNLIVLELHEFDSYNRGEDRLELSFQVQDQLSYRFRQFLVSFTLIQLI
jgi:hypothetical protein